MTIAVLLLMAILTARSQTVDSLTLLVQRGDSLMKQYNTYEALKYYKRAYDLAVEQDSVYFSMNAEDPTNPMLKAYVPEDRVPRQLRLKLADCHYQRASYHQVSELLKNMPEDSLTHESFRQLAYSYRQQGDAGAFMYWAGQLVNRYPMDGEVVAGLTLAYVQAEQPQNGVACALRYFKADSTNIKVNRALADAYFVDHQFQKANAVFEQLLQQGDSTFNTLYSAGMCYTKTNSLERAYQCLKPALWLSNMKHPGAAWRLGVVSIDTKRYEEGLACLSLAIDLMRPDTAVMRAITLSQGEGYYLTNRYPEAVDAWKQHLTYNPGSVSTYYNIANALAYLIKDDGQAYQYYRQFLELARQEAKPTQKLVDMMLQAQDMVKYYEKKKKK